MATNFFENQQRARNATGRLVFLFVLAVIGVVFAMNLAVHLIFFGLEEKNRQYGRSETNSQAQAQVSLVVTLATLGLITVGTLFRMMQMSGGGSTVATMLGGRRVDPATQDLAERRLLNVVEEMAIASGVSVPDVYVLRDDSINAFAAGLTPKAAVIGVTEGCMRKLTRDELQGVIAHEFSHIFNGDMRLNVRLIGVLAGIQVIGSLGMFILRNVRTSRSSKKNDGAVGILLIGFAMMVIGYVGVFFARLIKAAVSRQREYLADASAVQFTRNPFGIGMALKKIGADAEGSLISSRHAEEMSHLFFGEALSLSSLFATHPPLEARLKQIDPRLLQMETPKVQPTPLQDVDAKISESLEAGLEQRRKTAMTILTGTAAAMAPATPSPRGTADMNPVVDIDERDVMTSIGTISSERIKAASAFIENLPPAIHCAVHEPISTQALLCALLLSGASGSDETRAAHDAIRTKESDALLKTVQQLLSDVQTIGPAARIPLIELCVPTLRMLPASDRRNLLMLLHDLILADQKCDMHEYALYTVISSHLIDQRAKTHGNHSINHAISDAVLVLSALAHEGARRGQIELDWNAAFKAGFVKLRSRASVTTTQLLPKDRCQPEMIENALRALDTLSPMAKGQFIEACVAVIVRDRHVTVGEYELLQAICISLGCPLPPLGLPVGA